MWTFFILFFFSRDILMMVIRPIHKHSICFYYLNLFQLISSMSYNFSSIVLLPPLLNLFLDILISRFYTSVDFHIFLTYVFQGIHLLWSQLNLYVLSRILITMYQEEFFLNNFVYLLKEKTQLSYIGLSLRTIFSLNSMFYEREDNLFLKIDS